MINLTKEQLLSFLEAELEGNLMILLDPKQKDSFSQARITTWKKTVSERIYIHFIANICSNSIRDCRL